MKNEILEQIELFNDGCITPYQLVKSIKQIINKNQ